MQDNQQSAHPYEPQRTGRLDCGTDARRDYELTILWRTVAWSNSFARAEKLMHSDLDPHERLIQIVLEALDAGLETHAPPPEDLGILLGSSDPRVRLAGVRLAGRVR